MLSELIKKDKKTIDASKKANIKKFVMLSSMGADKPEETTQLQEFFKAKYNADEYLKVSGVLSDQVH
jgi:hypothetical protein